MRIVEIMTPANRQRKLVAVMPVIIAAIAAMPTVLAASTFGEELRSRSNAVDDIDPADRNAQPIKRVPPRFPGDCIEGMSETEQISLRFDVDPSGKPQHIEVIDSTNTCFDNTAINAVSRWEYQPKTSNGKTVWRRGVQTLISFQFSE